MCYRGRAGRTNEHSLREISRGIAQANDDSIEPVRSNFHRDCSTLIADPYHVDLVSALFKCWKTNHRVRCRVDTADGVAGCVEAREANLRTAKRLAVAGIARVDDAEHDGRLDRHMGSVRTVDDEPRKQ